LQETKSVSKLPLPKFFYLLKNYEIISLLLYAIHILLNFAGTPAIKAFYVFEMIFFLILAFKYKWRDLFIPTIVLFFIEGQGRILGSYFPLHRIIFDLYLFTLALRHYIARRSIMLPNQIPTFFKFVILAHFGWYLVQFFNIESYGPLAVFVASKVYIFPFIMFFMFLEDPISQETNEQQARYFSLLWVLSFQLALIFFQLGEGEQSLLKLTPYYRKPLAGDIFTGEFFRPFGTGFGPGSISVYLACSVSFLFLSKKKSLKQIITTIILILLIYAACFVMQVRVALIMALFITFACSFVLLLKSKLKVFSVAGLIFFGTLIPTIFANIDKVQTYFPDVDLSSSINRLQAISTVEGAASRRGSFEKVFTNLFDRLEKAPMGLGPGHTGAAAGMFKELMDNDPKYGLAFSWALDNLYISLAIDFGWGMIFYTIIILAFPFYILSKTISNWKKNPKADNKVGIPLSSVLIILITTWGAISIPYNPISFFYWFWLAYSLQLLSQDNSHRVLNE